MPHTVPSLDALLTIVHAEFLEMPGMRLTREQVRRLWHLDEELCDVVTRRLLQDRVVELDRRGRLHLPSVTP